jgi:hypothetical protein
VPAVLYVVSYYCVVQVQQRPTFIGAIAVASAPGQPQWLLALKPAYRFGGAMSSSVYGPIHTLDRKLRPDTWSVPLSVQRMKPADQWSGLLWAGM